MIRGRHRIYNFIVCILLLQILAVNRYKTKIENQAYSNVLYVKMIK